MSITESRANATSNRSHGHLTMTISASIQARWGHRVDDLIHTHAWTVSAVVEGDADADKIYPADDLEAVLLETVAPWHHRYLTDTDVGEWKGYAPLVWDREPTVEEIARRLWGILVDRVPGLIEIGLEEAAEFDRCRIVRLARR